MAGNYWLIRVADNYWLSLLASLPCYFLIRSPPSGLSQSCALLSDCGRNSGSTEVAPNLKTARGRPPRGLGGVEGRRPKTIGAVPVPLAEPAPLSLPGSAWGLRWVTGSLDPGSTHWVLLSEASSALPTPRLGA